MPPLRTSRRRRCPSPSLSPYTSRNELNENTIRNELIGFHHTEPLLVQVGKLRQNFWLNEGYLRSRSIFFKNATKGSWLSKDRAITLPGFHPKVFNLYTLAIMNQKVPYGWLDVYVLAEFLVDITTKNKMIQDIIEICRSTNKPIKPHGIATIYAGTSSGSPARRLCVELSFRPWTEHKYAVTSSLPADFVIDMGWRYLNKSEEFPDPFQSPDSFMEDLENRLDAEEDDDAQDEHEE